MVGRESWVVVTPAAGQVVGHTRCQRRRGSAQRASTSLACDRAQRALDSPATSARGVAVGIATLIAGAASPRRMREDRQVMNAELSVLVPLLIMFFALS